MTAPFMLTEAQAEAIDALVGLDDHLWFDIATALACSEVEVIVEVLRQFGVPESVCEQIIAAHAVGDDEGDSHYQVSAPS